MDSDPLLVVRAGAGALVTLNRPEKRNALSIELRWQLAETLESLARDQGVTAIGLTGAGTAFCAGMDVTQFGGDADHKRELVESSIRSFRAVAECPKPTVALVNGPALAGGFALALLCDLRIAAPEATFGFPELRRAIPPAYAAAASALTPAVARDLCLTGRVINAQEALALGVVSRISSERTALEEVAQAPGPATSEIKRRILRHRGGASPRELLADEEEALRAALLGRRGE
jgi:enoyl-CoA hydratase/carnithine racemase